MVASIDSTHLYMHGTLLCTALFNCSGPSQAVNSAFLCQGIAPEWVSIYSILPPAFFPSPFLPSLPPSFHSLPSFPPFLPPLLLLLSLTSFDNAPMPCQHHVHIIQVACCTSGQWPLWCASLSKWCDQWPLQCASLSKWCAIPSGNHVHMYVAHSLSNCIIISPATCTTHRVVIEGGLLLASGSQYDTRCWQCNACCMRQQDREKSLS